MKCVCPMGGDRTCPGDCPLAVWGTLSSTDRKSQRKPIAERLYKQGFTMEGIATQLGVHHSQIVRDLKEFVHDAQTQTRTSKRGRKGEGRPKGSNRKSKPKQTANKELQIIALADKGMSSPEIAATVGVEGRAVRHALEDERIRREAKAEPDIERADLSLTAQEKLDAAIRQHKRRLDLSFESRVLDEIRKRIDEMVLPNWKQQIEQAKTLYERRRGAMDKETFNTIRRALHPDSRKAISDKKLGEAFDTFMRLEKYLLNEKDSPTDWSPGLPSSLAEWDRMRARRRRPSGPTAMQRR